MYKGKIMKRVMKVMSIVFVLATIATAEDLGGNPEVSIKKNNPTTVLGHCDPLKRFLGLCNSANDILENN